MPPQSSWRSSSAASCSSHNGLGTTPARCRNTRKEHAAIDSIVAGLGGWIVAIISAGGYLGVAGLMAMESACLPLPSEIIMPFAGYLVSTGRFNLALVATAGAVGCNAGSAVAYAVGASGGRAMALRWGRYILLSPEHLDRADRFFQRFGGPAVLIARLLPMVRTFIALPAGIARMPQVPFQIYTFVGSWPWCFALAYIGYVLGKQWNTNPRLHTVMRGLDLAVLGLIAAVAAWFAWRQVRAARRAGARRP